MRHRTAMRLRVLLGINPPEYKSDKSKTERCEKHPELQLSIFYRENLSLAGCSPAVPASVSVQLCKIQFIKLYLQPVKFSSQLPL